MSVRSGHTSTGRGVEYRETVAPDCAVLLRLANDELGSERPIGVKSAKAAVERHPGSIVARCLLSTILVSAGSKGAAREHLAVIEDMAAKISPIPEDLQKAIEETQNFCAEPQEVIAKSVAEAERLLAEFSTRGKRCIVEIHPRAKQTKILTAIQLQSKLEKIKWMKKCGKPNKRDGSVRRIEDWDDWIGPESEGSDRLNEICMKWYDEIIETLGDKADEALLYARSIEVQVYKRVENAVPYDPDNDVWYAPNAAAALAAFVAKLVALYVFAGCTLPGLLEDIWQWYAEGHWPCSCAYYPEEDQTDVLVVY